MKLIFDENTMLVAIRKVGICFIIVCTKAKMKEI